MARTSFKLSALHDAVSRFYDKKENFDKFSQFLQLCSAKESPRSKKRKLDPDEGMSLRILDYLVSVYSLRGCSVRGPDGTVRSIHDIYQSGLLCHGKCNYDAFRRTDKFVLEKHGQTLKTTLGQMTFFRDMIRYGILEYAQEHLAEIKTAMATDIARETYARERKRRRKTAAGERPPRRVRRTNKHVGRAYILAQTVTLSFNN